MEQGKIEEQSNDIYKEQEGKKPLTRIGSALKSTRQEKGLSIKEVAESLRIGEEQLIALETGEESLLPEKVFVKAMIRRVAEKLQIDPKALITDFEECKPIKNKPKAISTEIANDRDTRKSIHIEIFKKKLSKRSILFIAIPTLLILTTALPSQKLKGEKGTKTESRKDLITKSNVSSEGIRVRSTRPVKATIVSSDGFLLFDGKINSSTEYLDTEELDIYSTRPDLILIKNPNKKEFFLEKTAKPGWFTINIRDQK